MFAEKERSKRMHEQLRQLKLLLGEIDDLQKAAAVLEWDQQTYMPPGGIAARADQLATLQRLAHDRFVSADIGELLETLRPSVEATAPDSDDACLLTVTQRQYDKARKLPSHFVAKFAHTTAVAQNLWQQARAAKDFVKFQTVLAEVVELVRQEAEYLGYRAHIYDPLLDKYEPDMTTAEVQAVFSALKQALIPLIQQIAHRDEPAPPDVLAGTFDIEPQWEFGLAVLRQIGYDFTRGRQDRSAHPFTTTFSPDDVRITTRLNPTLLTSAIFSSIHEGGHALYEQGIPPALARTPLGNGASMAVHESQSRFWENVIGRSREFWIYFLPRLQSLFPAQLSNVTVDQVYRAINLVRPDYIRVEADEVTYNLHIFLRFELETALLAGEIEVEDLPELWREKMKAYFDLTPPDAALGVLQDIHWSIGAFGYFPTYTLGNVLSMQFGQGLRRDLPEMDDLVQRGEFQPLLQWLRDHLHVHGAKFTPQELVRRVTGEPLNPQPYITYLQTKYGQLYGLSMPS